ncbi:MAG: chemotaxis protein CheC [bacterium]
MEFNLMNIDMLKEVANIGTGNATTSLSKLINQRIAMDVPTVNMPAFDHLADHIGGAEALIAGLLVSVSGDIDGLMLYLMTEQAACNLANTLMGSEKDSFVDFNELETSMLTEIGNILTSSYLTALSQLMNYKITQSVPSLALDMANAILSLPATEFSYVADKVLFIESRFGLFEEKNNKHENSSVFTASSDEDIAGFFMLIPAAN